MHGLSANGTPGWTKEKAQKAGSEQGIIYDETEGAVHSLIGWVEGNAETRDSTKF